LPKYEEKLRALSAQVERRLRKLESRSGLAPKDEQGRSMQTVNVAGGENSWGRLLWKTTGSFLQAVGVAVFVPFLSGYALIEKDALLAAAHGLGWTPPLALSSARMIRAYFLGLLAAFGGLAAAQTLLFAALRLENPLGLGLLTAFANILPVIGLPVAVVLASGQALLQVEGLAPYLILAAGLSALHVLASTVVLPRFVGTQLRLGALASTLALLFWGWLWGALGFLLALPLTGLALLALEAHPRSRPYAALLAAKGS
jgi:predicted PurR-regulated permease PerM